MQQISSTIPISLEFFPPKDEEKWAAHQVVRQKLYALNPEYCSVTFGAGGSTQAGTSTLVSTIHHEGKRAAMHLSCVGAMKSTISEIAKSLKADGLRHIVALRGDIPSGYGAGGEFHHASDLVRFLREEEGDFFHISVAAYPEIHPQARSATTDLQAFVDKINAGANDAITQYFFNADAYFRFRDDAVRLGVTCPIIPGIMPIGNSSQLLRFSDSCGAEVPRWLRLRLQSFGDDIASIKSLGLDVVSTLCEQLVKGGAPALHFYTMNQSDAVLGICKNLDLV